MDNTDNETLESVATPGGWRIFNLASTAVTPAHDVYDYIEGQTAQSWNHVLARYSNVVGSVIIHVNGVYGDGPISRDDIVIVRDCQCDV